VAFVRESFFSVEAEARDRARGMCCRAVAFEKLGGIDDGALAVSWRDMRIA